ncbi:MAG: two-component system response regulator [Chloroflexi bacterium]|nr:response regulator [Chloroflexi bacterium CFX2]MCQ3937260.1 two-component system response regulator [Chloroflexota bacterium]MDL1943502.1 response regulator [Chloroflexi bacterium CFX2]
MKKILLIEDIEDNANLVRKILAANNYEFLWARSAWEGLSTAQAHKPDLILLDLGLPDMDGQTISFFLREDPDLAHVPLVAMTAWPEDTALKMVEAYQLDAYIGKPFAIKNFLETIERLLAGNE